MFIERFNLERVLADCDSKRRMLAQLDDLAKAWWTTNRSADEARGGNREMALTYSNRTGYRDEWRPDLGMRSLQADYRRASSRAGSNASTVRRIRALDPTASNQLSWRAAAIAGWRAPAMTLACGGGNAGLRRQRPHLG